MMTMSITKEFSFEAAHRLMNHEGLCKNLHGHSYRLVVTARGTVGFNGMVVDFGVLSEAVRSVLAPFDHALLLYEHDPLLISLSASEAKALQLRIVTVPGHPTAENLASLFASLLLAKLAANTSTAEVKITQVEVWETAKSRAIWTTEEA